MFEKLRRAWHTRDLDKRIAKHGWTAIYVGDYASAPTWAYSIGFQQSIGQPEIVIFDLPHDAANGIFWTAHEELKAGKLVLEDGQRWHEEDEEKPLVWRKVHPTQIESSAGWFTLANARRLAQTGAMFGVEAYQLVLSDEAGKLPWEAGYNEGLRPRQPALYLPARDYGDAPLSPPELEAFTPEADMAANVLHAAREHLARDELKLTDGLRWDALGFEVCWRRVDEELYLALGALRLAKLRHEVLSGRRQAVETYQLFLPDDAGRYPWETGCDRGFALTQPPLFQPFDWAQRERGPLAALMRM